MTDDNEWITVEDAAVILGTSSRQANYLGTQGKFRTRRATAGGRRVLYHRGEVEVHAAERVKPTMAPPKHARAELMPIGEYRAHVERLEDTLATYARRIGYLEGQLEERKHILEDSQQLREDVQALRRERDRLAQDREQLAKDREQLQRALEDAQRRPWWRRLFGG